MDTAKLDYPWKMVLYNAATCMNRVSALYEVPLMNLLSLHFMMKELDWRPWQWTLV